MNSNNINTDGIMKKCHRNGNSTMDDESIIETRVGNDYVVSTDKNRLELEMIHNYLSKESYWAKGRTMETVKASIDNSFNFGVYFKNSKKQVGFTRVVTDGVTFAWLCDVFILPEHAKQGLGKAAVNHEHVRNCKRILLATGDAHGLYERFGFERMTPKDCDKYKFKVFPNM